MKDNSENCKDESIDRESGTLTKPAHRSSFHFWSTFIYISTMSPKGPFRLMTVNTAPARAQRVIGALMENLKDRYTINYVANSTCGRMSLTQSIPSLLPLKMEPKN